jgi:hypothetical protein
MLMDSLSGPFVLLTAPWRPELSEGVCDLRGQFIPTSRGSSDAQPNKTTFCEGNDERGIPARTGAMIFALACVSIAGQGPHGDSCALFPCHARHDRLCARGLLQGLITEWYPYASLVGPTDTVGDMSLYQPRADGTISWDSVALEPERTADFPRDVPDVDNRYYAARETSASSLCVHTAKGDQHEKFLFYRASPFFPCLFRRRPCRIVVCW